MAVSSRTVARIVDILAKRYAKKADMDLGNPRDTLLGVLLSARTTDAQVLKIFSAFTKRFPTFESLAQSTPAEIGTYISSVGLYPAKARAIHGLAKIVIEKHGGRVPGTMEELLELPGVGRKTANCVLGYVFGQDTICVDTHVLRIANRLGWSNGRSPERVERDLQALAPKRVWRHINRTVIQFGRDVCKAGKPQCWRCPIARFCPYEPKTPPPAA